MALSGDASPLMAEHNNFLYIVARNQQMKVKRQHRKHRLAGEQHLQRRHG